MTMHFEQFDLLREENDLLNKHEFYNFIYGVVLDSLTDRVELIKLLNNNVKAYLEIYRDADLGRNKSKNISKQRKYEHKSIDVVVSTCLQGISIIMYLEDEHYSLADTYKEMNQDFTQVAYDLYEQLNYKSNKVYLEKAAIKESLKNAPTPSTPVKKERRSL